MHNARLLLQVSFIHDAKEESIQTILEMAEYKKEGKLKALIVTGCLAQRYQQEIIDEIPEVDAVLGTTSYDHIVEAVEEALAGNGHVVLEDVDALPDVKEKRLVTTIISASSSESTIRYPFLSDRKSTRLNSSHRVRSRMPSSA